MKSLRLMLLTLLALPVMAQQQRDATDQEKQWVAIHAAAVAPTYADGIGLSPAGTKALVAHAQEAMAQLPVIGKAFVEGVCAQKGTADANALAYIENHQDDDMRFREKVISDLEQALSPVDFAQFVQWVQENVDPSVTETPKASDLIRSGELSTKDVVDRACEKGGGK